MASFFFKGSWSVCFFSFLTENFILETLSKVINMNKIAQLSILPFHVMPKCNLFEIPKYPKQSQVFRNMACRLFPDPVWKSTKVLTYLTIHKDHKKVKVLFCGKENASWFVGVRTKPLVTWNSGNVPPNPSGCSKNPGAPPESLLAPSQALQEGCYHCHLDCHLMWRNFDSHPTCEHFSACWDVAEWGVVGGHFEKNQSQ